MLYKAIRAVIEKAPIDAVTGNSRNTLAEVATVVLLKC
jgi:hypothetical protein